MYCRKCGNQIPNDSLFCPKCGADVAEENDKVTNGEQDILTPEQVTQKSAAEECDSLQKEKAGAHDNVTSSLEKGNDKELKKQNDRLCAQIDKLYDERDELYEGNLDIAKSLLNHDLEL